MRTDPRTFATDRLSVLVRLLLAACLVAATASLVLRRPPAPPGGDQPRYATVALKLADHGVFSADPYDAERRPAPGLAWAGPIIAAEIGAVARLHPPTHAALVCMATTARQSCDTTFTALRLVHVAEVLAFLAAVGALAWTVLASERLAWIAAGLALAFRETTEFTNLVLAEPLFLCLSSVLLAMLAGGLVLMS